MVVCIKAFWKEVRRRSSFYFQAFATNCLLARIMLLDTSCGVQDEAHVYADLQRYDDILPNRARLYADLQHYGDIRSGCQESGQRSGESSDQ